jgi:recombination protein RecT
MVGKEKWWWTMSQTAIVKRTADVILSEKKEQFLAVLPKNIDRDRFYAVAIAICKDRALASCTDASKLDSIYRIAKLGLDPDPVMGEAYVLPRKMNLGTRERPDWGYIACFQPGYRGLTKLARNTRGVADIHAEVVYEGEPFEVSFGTSRQVTHTPWYAAGIAEPTAIRLAYCTWLDMNSQRVQFHIVQPSRIERAQNANKDRDGNPSKVWQTDTAAMVRKTAIIDASKLWPLSAEMAEAVDADERLERDEVMPPKLPPAMQDADDTPPRSELDDFAEGEYQDAETSDHGNAADAKHPAKTFATFDEFRQAAVALVAGTDISEDTLSKWIGKQVVAAGKRGKESELPAVLLAGWYDELKSGKSGL